MLLLLFLFIIFINISLYSKLKHQTDCSGIFGSHVIYSSVMIGSVYCHCLECSRTYLHLCESHRVRPAMPLTPVDSLSNNGVVILTIKIRCKTTVVPPGNYVHVQCLVLTGCDVQL